MIKNNEARKERIKVLRRQQERSNQLPAILAKLSTTLQTKISENDVLSLEEIDYHQICVNSTDFEFNYVKLSYPTDQLEVLKNLLASFVERRPAIGLLALTGTADICVVKTNSYRIGKYFDAVVALDEYTHFSFYDSEYKNGLRINLFKEYWYLDNKLQFPWIYQLQVFGKEWIKTIIQHA